MFRKVFMHGKISLLTNVLVLSTVFLLFFCLKLPISNAQTQALSHDCGRWSAENVLSSNFYAGYGVPWDVTASGNPLFLHANCTGDGITFTVGNGNASQYVWGNAYISADGGAWKEISLSGSNQNGNWFSGQASVAIPSSMISTNGSNFILAYACTFDSGMWKCGCRDKNSCTESGHWQLQEVKDPASQITSNAPAAFHTPTLFYPSKYVVSRGETISVKGGGLAGQNSIFISGYGSAPASVPSDGSNITFTLPADIPYGRYDISADGLEGKSNSKFIVVKDPSAQAPVITGISDVIVQPGNSVTLYGTGFDQTKNQVRTNFGVISGVPSPDGKTLTFIFPEHQTRVPLSDSMMEVLKESGIDAAMLQKIQSSQAHTEQRINGTIIVVNDGGISARKEVTIEYH